MTTSSATHHRRTPCADATRRCRRNAAAGIVAAAPTATARALAAGLWRLRHAVNTDARRRHVAPHSPRHRRKAKLYSSSKTQCGFGVGFQCRNHSILDKIDACAVELPYGCSMEKATKWDQHVCLHNTLGSHVHHHTHATVVVALEAELEKARAQISDLEDEKRVVRKKVERFLKKLAEEKASWKSRAREVIATLKEDAKTERNHRRQLEAANGKLMKEVAEAKASAKQSAQSYEMERKAREMMEEACEELTKEVEEDQAEVELLRRECLGMREEMEEERRMLQMAEVWREERVQMKLSDAKVALEQKYSQLNTLQAEMESFLRKDGKSVDAKSNSSALREARKISEAASSVRLRGVKELSHQNPHTPEDVDRVFQHFCRKEENGTAANGGSPASPAASNVNSVSPATDIFLEKLDGDGSVGWDSDRRRDSCSSAGTSTDRSVARAGKKAWALSSASGSRGGSGLTDPPSVSRVGAAGKNTALIRRLWRSAISESRKLKTAGSASTGTTTQTPSSEQRSTVVTPTLPVGEQCSSSYSVKPQQQRSREVKGLAQGGPQQKQKQKQKQSLQEKLMEARMDDHNNKPLPFSAAKQKDPHV